MLRACAYCGRIHSRREVCRSRQAAIRKITEKDRFRSSAEWQKKRKEIQQRDHYLCQVCLRGLYGTVKRYKYDGTSVHHIIPLEEDFGKRMEDENLITLCQYHHELAEKNTISRKELLIMAAEQNETSPGGELSKIF